MTARLKQLTSLFTGSRTPGEKAPKHKVLEFPRTASNFLASSSCFQAIPTMIHDAFLRDLKDGRTNLWGWSYEEVSAALSLYRMLGHGEWEKATGGLLPGEREAPATAKK